MADEQTPTPQSPATGGGTTVYTSAAAFAQADPEGFERHLNEKMKDDPVLRDYVQTVSARYNRLRPIEELYGDEELNEESLKQLARLKDKRVREFVFNEAVPGFEGALERLRGQEPDSRVDGGAVLKPVLDRLDQIDDRDKKRDAAMQQQQVMERRSQEFQALAQEYPDMLWIWDEQGRVKDGPEQRRWRTVIKYANAETQRTGRLYSYKQAFEDLRDFEANREAPPPQIRATTPTVERRPTPVKSKNEQTANMAEKLQKAGSLMQLARLYPAS